MAYLPKKTLNVGKGYTVEQRAAIASDVIDFIVERTQTKSKDKNNEKFPSYSPSYKNSTDFKASGKSGNVDLTLSGDMLASIELVNTRDGTITIGFTDAEQGGKAEGNIKGTYGNGTRKRPSKARDFLGLTDTDLTKILKKYPQDNERKLEKRVEQSNYVQILSEKVAEKMGVEFDD